VIGLDVILLLSGAGWDILLGRQYILSGKRQKEIPGVHGRGGAHYSRAVGAVNTSK
jgi:hypothetical protein